MRRLSTTTAAQARIDPIDRADQQPSYGCSARRPRTGNYPRCPRPALAWENYSDRSPASCGYGRSSRPRSWHWHRWGADWADGVAIGAWFQGRRECQRRLRDQQLRAVSDFIGGTGDQYQRRRQLRSEGSSITDGQAAWVRVQHGRSALQLLCHESHASCYAILLTEC